MDCREWEHNLEALLDGTLPAQRRAEAQAHLFACPACRELFAAARGDRASLPTGEDPGLTRDILARTSGPACGRAAELLAGRWDSPPAAGDGALLDEHLAGCGDCAILASTLDWLAPLLPAMAEPDPGPRFTAAVLRATAQAPTRIAAPAWLLRLRALARQWWARPRFAMEAAYAGTLVLVFLFGTPVSPLREAPTRALSIMQNRESLAAPFAPSIGAGHGGIGELGRSAWAASGGKAAQASSGWRQDLAARGRSAGAALEALWHNTGALLSAAMHLDFVKASEAMDALKGDRGRAPAPPAAEPAAEPAADQPSGSRLDTDTEP
jgi:hypothetical protein